LGVYSLAQADSSYPCISTTSRLQNKA